MLKVKEGGFTLSPPDSDGDVEVEFENTRGCRRTHVNKERLKALIGGDACPNCKQWAAVRIGEYCPDCGRGLEI